MASCALLGLSVYLHGHLYLDVVIHFPHEVLLNFGLTALVVQIVKRLAVHVKSRGLPRLGNVATPSTQEPHIDILLDLHISSAASFGPQYSRGLLSFHSVTKSHQLRWLGARLLLGVR